MIPLLPFLLAGAGLSAQPVVVELFTARGCAACIPADRAFRQIRDRQGVILLTFPVTYWDAHRKDPDAQPAYTERQIRYAKVARREVYTPQCVVGGRFAFSDPARLGSALAAGQSSRGPTIEARGTTLTIGTDTMMARETTVWLAIVHATSMHDSRRKNATETRVGARSHDTRVGRVASIRAIGRWRGTLVRLPLPASRPGYERVILVQSDDGGAIVAAARLK